MRKILMSGLALAAIGMASSSALAQTARLDMNVAKGISSQMGVTDVQYRRYNRGYGYRRYDNGAAIGAGIAGLAAGAIIGGAIANSQQPTYYEGGQGIVGGDEESYCMQRFRSYDPRSGTYLGYDGMRHSCP
ncbi:MAG: hypothetical protein JWL62_1122 [Hyphomicrobiales bacterium]|nr:hypothetical protein [Hyphomicrobiales bacterium]